MRPIDKLLHMDWLDSSSSSSRMAEGTTAARVKLHNHHPLLAVAIQKKRNPFVFVADCASIVRRRLRLLLLRMASHREGDAVQLCNTSTQTQIDERVATEEESQDSEGGQNYSRWPRWSFAAGYHCSSAPLPRNRPSWVDCELSWTEIVV